MKRAHPPAWTALLAAAVAACGGSPARPTPPTSGAPATDGEESRDVPRADPSGPGVELFEASFGDTLEVGGQTLWFSGMSSPEDGRAAASLSLGESSSDPTLHLLYGGCALRDGWVYALLELTGPEHQLGRFARRPAPAEPAALEHGVEAELGLSWAVRVPSGLTAHLKRVHPYDDGTWRVVLEARLGDDEVDLDITAPAGGRASEARRTVGGHVITARVAGAADALGCPVVHLTVELPSVQVMTVRAGEAVTLRRDASAALGDLRVRYLGWGEAIPVEGPHEQFAEVETTVGDAPPRHHMCPIGETLTVEGYVIEALGADHDQTRLRLRRE